MDPWKVPALPTSSDRVTLVTFGSYAKVLAANQFCTEEGLQKIYSAIGAITATGGTNLSDGIEKLLSVQRSECPYHAVLLLTDGIINGGITSTAGLMSLAQSLGSCPFTTLGYGADHNRNLLRDLAVGSRGAYVFVIPEASGSLPTAVGDLIEGMHTEVLKNASIKVPVGWTCIEVALSSSSASSSSSSSRENQFTIGNIVPDREYWAVFRRQDPLAPTPVGPIMIMGTDSKTGEVFADAISHIPTSDCHELQEQVLRCRVAGVIMRATDCMERHVPIHSEVAELAAEIDAIPVGSEGGGLRTRPLVARMRAQLAEVIATASSTTAPTTAKIAHVSAGATCLANQRSAGDDTFGDVFASAGQRSRAAAVLRESLAPPVPSSVPSSVPQPITTPVNSQFLSRR